MTILNQEPIMSAPAWIVIVIIACILIAGISSVVLISYHGSVVIPSIFGILCLGGILTLAVLTIATPTEPSGRNRYEVLIDGSVPATEIIEKYNVTEQRGDIWVLEDKEVDEHDD